ncbi:hypothetical protein B0H14DRAFT_3583025 [Mycena olivaceomarginata]|nr:hypothetical protein B0H14DRAFT_3583025 [Mycena olivaceomarginata]
MLAYSESTAPPLQLQIGQHYQHRSPPPSNLTGLPHHYNEGRFSGQTLRAELHEIQRQKYGQKFGAVDRRALDDPPVILLPLFHVYNPGTSEQWEQEDQNYEYACYNLLLLVTWAHTYPPPFNLQPPPCTSSNPNFYSVGTLSTDMAPDRQYPIHDATTVVVLEVFQVLAAHDEIYGEHQG